jgi:hypothetical protein
MDVDASLVSRIVYTGAVDRAIAADIEPRHFADADMRAVYEMCVAHYRVWGQSPSIEFVRSRFPDVKFRLVTDDVAVLVQEFKDVAAERLAITKWQDIGRELDRVAAGDMEVRARLPEIFMEHAREMVSELPGTSASRRLSQMHERMLTIRGQQDEGVLPGVRICHPQLRPYIYAVRPTQFVVHVGISGVGKTTGLVRSGITAFEDGDRVLMVSLEMDEDEVFEMFDAHFAQLSRRAMERRELTDADYERAAQVARSLSERKNDIVVVSPTGGVTIDRLAALVEKFDPQSVLVDYVSLMKPIVKTRSKWEAVDDISGSLKALARSFKIKVFAAAQSGREAIDVGPTENNIADSLAPWRDCNVMVGYHQDPEMARQNKVQVRLIKNRKGDKGPPGDSGYFECYEYWDRDRLLFQDWSQQHQWATKAGIGVINGA